jgi:hypothetical protein
VASSNGSICKTSVMKISKVFQSWNGETRTHRHTARWSQQPTLLRLQYESTLQKWSASLRKTLIQMQTLRNVKWNWKSWMHPRRGSCRLLGYPNVARPINLSIFHARTHSLNQSIDQTTHLSSCVSWHYMSVITLRIITKHIKYTRACTHAYSKLYTPAFY